MADAHEENPYVSRGGLKLRAALDAFAVDPAGWVCVDLGCSTGGFTDCLLRAGAARVYAVDTAYGELAWKLRQDERVVVMERSNALHVGVPTDVAAASGLDLAVIDLGWTPQHRAIPAARRWVRGGGVIITLVKPHYEASARGSTGGVLEDSEAARRARETVDALVADGYACEGLIESPVLGGRRGRKGAGKGRGNREWLASLRVPSG